MDTITHPNTTITSTLAAVQDAALASPLSVGLAVFIALVPLVSLYRRRSGGRSKANNYGYGRVEVTKLLVHPIKSCRGTSVASARYTPEGMENDRKWCIVDADTHQVITAREVAKMVLITPTLPDATGLLRVSFPSDSPCEPFAVPANPSYATLASWVRISDIKLWGDLVDSYVCEAAGEGGRSPSAILSDYFERDVLLVMKGPKPRLLAPTDAFPNLKGSCVFQDGYPLLVLSEEGLDDIERELRENVGSQGIDPRWKEAKLAVERFRPNIVFKGAGPFEEDFWEEIAIGEPSAPGITLVSKCTRCLLPNVSPETGERDKAVPYKVLLKFRTGLHPKLKMKPCVGCNGVPKGEGVVRVGDAVWVRKMTR
ncbi:hypothetical protein K523DRAFT_239506 [Schizophyllum commune Tattone D]|nr:hypothetical protein K523DRAFT_239506 [Schizophyllum commune Tattone D]